MVSERTGLTIGVAETIGGRPTMEDAFSACDVGGPNLRATLLCVFDGHGGTRAVDLLAVRFGKKKEVLGRSAKNG